MEKIGIISLGLIGGSILKSLSQTNTFELFAYTTNDKTIILPALIDYYMKRSNSAIEQLDIILQQNPYNKHAYKLLCQIYREKHHENLLNATIKKYGPTAGDVED